MAMKVVRQARLELSGGSTPDQLRPFVHQQCKQFPHENQSIEAGVRGEGATVRERGAMKAQ